MFAGEGFGFGAFRWCFGALAEEEPDLLSGFGGGAGEEAVVADTGKSFGQDVEKPAANELIQFLFKKLHPACFASLHLKRLSALFVGMEVED